MKKHIVGNVVMRDVIVAKMVFKNKKIGEIKMSSIYVDRDGDEWKKNCRGCSQRYSKDGKTYCEALREYTSDHGEFSKYYSQYPNSCPYFYPKNNY
jgi:hypothetical protein